MIGSRAAMSSRSCAWVLLFGMTACALPPGMTVMRTAGKAGPALELEAIAVAEPEVTLLGVEPWHRWQRARDVLRVVEQRPAVDAVAPWEFDAVTRPTTPGGYATRTTLLRRARELGIDPKKVAVLEIQAMEGATGQVVEATRKAELRLHREYRSDVQLTVRRFPTMTPRCAVRASAARCSTSCKGSGKRCRRWRLR